MSLQELIPLPQFLTLIFEVYLIFSINILILRDFAIFGAIFEKVGGGGAPHGTIQKYVLFVLFLNEVIYGTTTNHKEVPFVLFQHT